MGVCGEGGGNRFGFVINHSARDVLQSAKIVFWDIILKREKGFVLNSW